jgi:Nucleotide-diphospho-sugar transferase
VDALITRLLVISSRIFARFACWDMTVFALSLVRPFAKLDNVSRGRLAYACSLANQNRRVRNLVANTIRRERNTSAATNLSLADIAWRLGARGLAQALAAQVRKATATPAQLSIAISQEQFARGIRDGSVARKLEASLDTPCSALKPDSPIVIVTVSGQYLEMFALWKRQLDLHLGEGQLLVIALDERATRTLRQTKGCTVLDLSSLFQFDRSGAMQDHSKRHLWVYRVTILKHLISLGYTVISFDVDAFLVGSLPRMLDALPAFEILAQRDRSIPMDVARKLGFVLCCGFLMIRPTPKTVKFLTEYLSQTVLELDDQTALNHLLARNPITNRVQESLFLSFQSRGISWVCPDPSLVSRDLNYGSVIRHFYGGIHSIDEVMHCLGLNKTDAVVAPIDASNSFPAIR